MITPEVEKAIAQLRMVYPDGVTVREDGEGGAYILVEPVDLSEQLRPSSTWVGFRITFQYPLSDVYPHFVRPDIVRADNCPIMTEGLQQNHTFEGRAAIQISRRSNRLNPRTDTALVKLQKVVAWLNDKARS